MSNQNNWIFNDLKLDSIRDDLDGNGVEVVVIDNGFNADLPALSHIKNTIDLTTLRSRKFFDEFKTKQNDEERIEAIEKRGKWCPIPPGESKASHGSKMSAIIGGRYKNHKGIAPECSITVIKVATKDRDLRTFTEENQRDLLALAIYIAVVKRAQLVNLSLEVDGCSTLLHNSVKIAFKQDTILICAAGNSPTDPNLSIPYPAAFQKTLTIGSYDRHENPYQETDKGTLLDFALPGESVASFLHPKASTLSGTSVSTALATGFFALTVQLLLIEKFPTQSRVKYHQLKKYLIQHTPIENNDRHSLELGYGRICPKELKLTKTTES